MNVQEIRRFIVNEIRSVYDSSEAWNVTELVLEKITGLEKTNRLIQNDYVLSSAQENALQKIIERLKKNEPVQYILEEAWFGGIKLKVNNHVLIPRPETEELVDWIEKEISLRYTNSSFSPSILDVGTGSGCIAIALKKKFPYAVVSAIDICSEALSIALENAVAHDTDIDFRLMDFLDEQTWADLKKYNVIVSNPPYVQQSVNHLLHPRVRLHEPELALFVPDTDVLLFYRKLADFARQHLLPGGHLFAEINELFGHEVTALFREKGFQTVSLKKDLQGKERMIRAGLDAER
jgi:release factor glutamine methyltransferase